MLPESTLCSEGAMSEPRVVAEAIEDVVSGVWRWYVWDDRIDFESDAYAVAADGGAVLIDPLPLREAALKVLEPIQAICLTAACHQRFAWRYRRTYGVPVYAPDGCREMDETPDVAYRPGEVLPGGLKAVHTPGPEAAHFAFLRETAPAVLFCPDLMMRSDDGGLVFIPGEYHDDPTATRDSVRRLLELPFSVLCLAHGAPLTTDPHGTLRKLLADDAKQRS